MGADKSELVRVVQAAIDGEKDMIVLADLGDAKAFSLQGDAENLSFMVVKAMDIDERFKNIFSIAFRAYRDTYGNTSLDDVMEALDRFKPLDCDNCDISEGCKVRDEVHCAKDMPDDLAEFLKGIFKTKNDNDEKES